MPTILEDNGWTVATEHGPSRLSAPFPHTTALYVLEQDFMVNEANFSPLALNTPHATLPAYKLVSEGPPTIEGGVRTWTRKYAQVPDSWSEINKTLVYNFIGFWGVILANSNGNLNSSEVAGRPRRSRAVNVKAQHDFFLVGPGGLASEFFISVSSETKYYSPSIGLDLQPVEIDYLTDTVMGGTTLVASTTPSMSTYRGWMASDAASGDSFSIIVQASNITRWMGNIFQRETLYIKAI